MRPHTRGSAAFWLLSAAAAAVYAVMWLGYRQGWCWLDRIDSSTLRIGYDIGVKHHGWVQFWDAVCTALAPTTFRLIAMGAAAALLSRHRTRAALFVIVSVEFSGLLSESAKGLANRPRPITAMVAVSSSSFPSGHALGAMTGVAALLAVVLPLLGRWIRTIAVVAGVVIVVMVGLGRVALNVHHLSDVVAGWSLGLLYVLVCARLLRPGTDGIG